MKWWETSVSGLCSQLSILHTDAKVALQNPVSSQARPGSRYISDSAGQLMALTGAHRPGRSLAAPIFIFVDMRASKMDILTENKD
jgi:hypothetical protein